jgi:CRP-like cAMP-binding protein
LEVKINGNTKRYLKKTDGFGELALLYNSPRSASILAIEETILWGIDRANFKRVVQETIIKEFTINQKFINGVDVFSKNPF